MKKQSATIQINKPVKVVWDYLNNLENMPEWIDEFVRYEQVSGELGAVGSMGRHHYKYGKNEMIMHEEMIANREHEHIKISLTSKMFDMTIINNFREKNGRTELHGEVGFTRMNMFMKLVTMFKSDKKSSAEYMEQFDKIKQLVEAR